MAAMNIVITGGFEPNFSVGFARGLAANGVELTVVSCDETASRLTSEGIVNVNLRGSLSNTRSVWARLTNLASYYARLIALLFRNRGATVHFTGMFRNEFILWEGLAMNPLIRLLAGRYIYTVHNVLPHSREHSPLFRRIYRWIYRAPHILLVHTERAGRQLMDEFGVAEGRIRQTSIGLNEEMPVTALSQADARNRLGFGSDEQLVLFFGKIDEYKGLDLLLEAFDRLRLSKSRLVIAGEFRNPAYRTRIQSQLEKLSRRADVHVFERFIPNDEAEVFFNASDVLCLPYRHIYQSGLVFLGPRFGIPMVTTDVGSLKEFVADDFGIVTRTNDAVGIAEALGSYFAAPGRFRRESIFQRAQKYQWTAVCRELLPLYSRGDTGRTVSQPVQSTVATMRENGHPSTLDRGSSRSALQNERL